MSERTKELRERYSYALQFMRGEHGIWIIYDTQKAPFWDKESIIFETPYDPNDHGDEPPKALRDEYERLIEWDASAPDAGDFVNLVELMCADDDGGFDQPCHYGNRVEGHAVYCHNDWWLYSPRKCHRTWYTGGERRDEDCPGYRPNARSGQRLLHNDGPPEESGS